MRRVACYMALLVLSAWMGCVDKVDFDAETPSNLPLIVDGSLVRDDTARVALSTAYPVDGKYYVTNVLGAKVWITCLDDPGFVLDLFASGGQDNATLYEATKVVDVVEGYRYQLNVMLSGGQLFVSAPQQVSGAGEIENIYFEFVSGFNRERNVQEDGFNVYVDSKLPPGDTWYLRWKMNGTYMIRTEIPADCLGCPGICWVSDREDYPLLARSQFITGETLRRTLVKYIPINIQTFNNRYRVEVVQQSVTAEAWEFYSALEHQLKNASSLFQPAISSPRGNVTAVGAQKPVIGIFTASAATRKSIYIKSSDVPYRVKGTIPVGPCTNLPHTSMYPPPFWN